MSQERGDTLVEVLIAIAILSAAIVTGLGAMNYGFGLILNSIERTQVQAEMSSQLSLIQYTRAAYIKAERVATPNTPSDVWAKLVARARTSYQPLACSSTGAPQINAGLSAPFYVNETGDNYVDGIPAAATTYAQAGRGLWVEAVKPSATTNYVDVYVKACWKPSVGNTNQEARTVMRLYVP